MINNTASAMEALKEAIDLCESEQRVATLTIDRHPEGAWRAKFHVSPGFQGTGWSVHQVDIDLETVLIDLALDIIKRLS